MPCFTRTPIMLRTAQHLLTRPTLTTSQLSISRHTASSILPSSAPVQSVSSISSRNASTQSTHGAAEHTQSGEEHHDDGAHNMYEPPSGWLWGVPPGEQYKKEGWEGLWYYGFYGSLVLTAIAYAWKPDTSIETWALEEAKRRLQAEGILPEEE